MGYGYEYDDDDPHETYSERIARFKRENVWRASWWDEKTNEIRTYERDTHKPALLKLKIEIME